MTDLRASLTIRLVDQVSRSARQIDAALRRIGSGTTASSRAASSALAQLDAASRGSASATQRAAAAATAEAAAESAGTSARAKATSSKQTATAASEQHAAAMQQEAAAASTARRGFLRVDRAAKLQGRRMAEQINLASELALGFGSLSPATQALGLSFATAGNNAFAFANSMGPIGVVAGTLFGIIPGLISLFNNLGESASASARRVTEFEDALSSIREQRQRRERLEQAIAGELGADEISDLAQATIGEDIKPARDALRSATGSIGELLGIGDTGRAIASALIGDAASSAALSLRARDLSEVTALSASASSPVTAEQVRDAFDPVSEKGETLAAQTLRQSEARLRGLRRGQEVATLRERGERAAQDAQLTQSRLQLQLRGTNLSQEQRELLLQELSDTGSFREDTGEIQISGRANRLLGRLGDDRRGAVEGTARTLLTRQNESLSLGVQARERAATFAAIDARRAGGADRVLGFSTPSGGLGAESRIIRAERGDPSLTQALDQLPAAIGDAVSGRTTLRVVVEGRPAQVDVSRDAGQPIEIDTDVGGVE